MKPEFDYCYRDSCGSKFMEERSIDPRETPYGSELYEEWARWRARRVTETVQFVLSKVKRAYPSMEVSAAVPPRRRLPKTTCAKIGRAGISISIIP